MIIHFQVLEHIIAQDRRKGINISARFGNINGNWRKSVSRSFLCESDYCTRFGEIIMASSYAVYDLRVFQQVKIASE